MCLKGSSIASSVRYLDVPPILEGLFKSIKGNREDKHLKYDEQSQSQTVKANMSGLVDEPDFDRVPEYPCRPRTTH